MIKMQIIGNIGADCVIRDVSGKKVINFNVAHSEKRKQANGTNYEFTTWVSCSWWMENTSIAAYLKKGQQVYVEGSPSVNAYAKDGKCIGSQNLTVRALHLLGKAGGGEQRDQEEAGADHNNEGLSGPPAIEGADDLPF